MHDWLGAEHHMGTLGTLVVLALGIGLLVLVVLMVRSGGAITWPAIGLAALTSGICFTVGGSTDHDTTGPDIDIVMGSVVGLLCLVAVIAVLVPTRRDGPVAKAPVWLSLVGIVLGAVGLLLSTVTA